MKGFFSPGTGGGKVGKTSLNNKAKALRYFQQEPLIFPFFII
jgi:hypothetical protein